MSTELQPLQYLVWLSPGLVPWTQALIVHAQQNTPSQKNLMDRAQWKIKACR